MSITVGVIGCGNISKFHFAALEKAGARIKWVCDLNEQTARPWAEKSGAAFTQDFNQVTADPAVQAVFVLPISSTHKTICLNAIAAGKAVVCEKTLAENAADAYEIVRAAEQKGVLFYTSYMKRYIPAVVKAKELLPGLGRVFSSYFRTYQPWGDIWGENPSEGFFHTPPGGKSAVVKNYGGGILVCGGSHVLDLICFFLGRPHRLSAAMFQPSGRDYDLLASALLETPNGVVHFEAAAHPMKKIGHLRDGWDERIEINGTLGRLEIYSALWDQADFKDSLLVHYDDEKGTATEYRFGPVSPFERAIASYCTQIAKGQQGNHSIYTGYDVDELIETVRESAARSQTLEVRYRIG
jgi:predicted dehydrogenase